MQPEWLTKDQLHTEYVKKYKNMHKQSHTLVRDLKEEDLRWEILEYQKKLNQVKPPESNEMGIQTPKPILNDLSDAMNLVR